MPAGWAGWALHRRLQSKLLILRNTMTSQRHLLASRLAPMCSALEQQRRTTAPTDVSDALAAAAAAAAQRQQQRINFHVGVLHYTPSSEPFPLLDDAVEVSEGSVGATKGRECGRRCGGASGLGSAQLVWLQA